MGWFSKRKNAIIEFGESEQNKLFVNLSGKKPVKTDTKLIVPKNYVAVLCYQRKIYYELIAGEYILNTLTISDIIKKQYSKDDSGLFSVGKIKQFKLQIYLLNILKFNQTIVFLKNDYRFDNKLKGKLNLNCQIEYIAQNPKLLLKRLFEEIFFINENKVKNCIHNWFYEEVVNYIRKQPLPQKLSLYDSNYQNKMLSKFNNIYDYFGLKINGVKLEYFSDNTKIKIYNTQNLNDENLSDKKYDANLLDNVQNSQYNTNILLPSAKSVANDSYCPNCEAKRIENSAYCHVCGHKLI